jgi:hypothetical protein
MRKLTIFFLIFLMLIPVAYASPDEYELDIARRKVDGILSWGMSGHTEDSTVTVTTLWSLNTRYVFPPVASSMTVSSSDVNDDYNDTGAWIIQVTGLDENYTKIRELVVLDGQNPVNTTNEFFRINGVTVGLNGESNYNEGAIYVGTGAVVAGVPANIYGYIVPTYSIANTGLYTVAQNETLYITKLWYSTYSNKAFEIHIRAWSPSENMTNYNLLERHTSETNIEMHVDPPYVIPSGFTIEITEQSDQAGGKINVDTTGVLVDETLADSALVMGDINWLVALIWVGLLGIGIGKGKPIMILFAGFVGLILGLLMMPISSMVSIALILLNFYLLYSGSSS